MGKYNVGDRVRVSKGETVLEGRVADVHGNGYRWDLVLPVAHQPEDLNQAIFMEWYEREGFDIEVIEEAKPKLKLPSEHGIYTAGYSYARIYTLDADGWTFYRHGVATKCTEKQMIEALQNVEGTALEKLVRLVREDGK